MIIAEMLKTFGQRVAKPVSTPADLNVKLQKEDGVSGLVDAILYLRWPGGSQSSFNFQFVIPQFWFLLLSFSF